MPRLFTGLQIPAPIRSELMLVRGGMGGARWIDEGDLHLTLRFAGDVTGDQAHEILHELEAIRRPPCPVTLERLAVFGGDRPRAIVALARLEGELIGLQGEHERAMRRAGLPAEGRKFTPHVTLARLRAVPATAAAAYLAARGFFQPRTFLAPEFVLYSSRASTGGGPYVVEAAFPLSGQTLKTR